MRISDWSSDVCSSDLLNLKATANITSQEHPFVIPSVLWTRKTEAWRKKPLTPVRSWCRKITWPAPTRQLQQLGTSNLRILPWKHTLSCPAWTAPPALVRESCRERVCLYVYI